jgi:hypothetical protein
MAAARKTGTQFARWFKELRDRIVYRFDGMKLQLLMPLAG